MISHSISSPMNSFTSRARRMLTWLAGRNAGTPMSISRPPLIFLVTLPWTVSPSLCASITRCQFILRSALRLESWINPSGFSSSSISTVISWPILGRSASFSNSRGLITPTVLAPISTMKRSFSALMTRPLTNDSSLKWRELGTSISPCGSRHRLSSSASTTSGLGPNLRTRGLMACCGIREFPERTIRRHGAASRIPRRRGKSFTAAARTGRDTPHDEGAGL